MNPKDERGSSKMSCKFPFEDDGGDDEEGSLGDAREMKGPGLDSEPYY
jgi:hypothetical protein